jgi:hypothetical protein
LFHAYKIPVGVPDSTPNANLGPLLDESRRQLDRQAARHDAIKDTAKTLLPINLAVIAFAASIFGRTTARHEPLLVVLWLAAVIVVGASALGAGAMLDTRATFGMIDVNLFTAPGAVQSQRELCVAHLQSVGDGENTLATRLAVIRTAVALQLLGVALLLLVWLLARRA